MVAAQQTGRDGQNPGALDEPRRRACVIAPAENFMELRPEGHAAPAEHQESGDHDPRVSGVRRREPADLKV
jgi:hypothetical protein